MDNKDRKIEFVINNLKQQDEQTRRDRAVCWMEIKPEELIPNEHFAPVSAECNKLYRDSHYHGCILLAQALAEEYARFLCRKNPPLKVHQKSFETNISIISKKKLISNESIKALKKAYEDRHPYHHLDPSIKKNCVELQKLAKEKVLSIHMVEREIFARIVNRGGITPIHPQYWDIKNGKIEGFLQCEP